MNWFNILKDAKTMQGQRQGFRLDDKDEDYVLEDDDNDCYEQFVKIAEKVKASFPNGEKRGGKLIEPFIDYDYDNFRIETAINILPKGALPDEAYCKAIELFKRLTTNDGEDVQETEPYYYAQRFDTLYAIMVSKNPEARFSKEKSSFIEVRIVSRIGEEVPTLEDNFDEWSGFL